MVVVKGDIFVSWRKSFFLTCSNSYFYLVFILVFTHATAQCQ